MASLGLIGSVYAKPVKCRRTDLRSIAAGHLIGTVGEIGAEMFGARL
jgi:hypothetical protein